MMKNTARKNAKLDFNSIYGAQEYLELATVDAFKDQGYNIEPCGKESIRQNLDATIYSLELDNTNKISIITRLVILDINSDDYLLNETEILGALIFSYQYMLHSECTKIYLFEKDSATYLSISSRIYYRGETKQEIDQFLEDHRYLFRRVLYEMNNALESFKNNRHLFASIDLKDITNSQSVFAF